MLDREEIKQLFSVDTLSEDSHSLVINHADLDRVTSILLLLGYNSAQGGIDANGFTSLVINDKGCGVLWKSPGGVWRIDSNCL